MDQESINAVAQTASDVIFLVNNAGISTGASLIAGDLGDVRKEMDAH
ncbi:hypothetical protein [Rhodococcus sp. SJ-3]